MPPDEIFVLAVKRERRGDVPADWQEVVRGTSGVTVTGDASPSRMQIRASDDAIAQLRSRFADDLHIEKMISHRYQ